MGVITCSVWRASALVLAVALLYDRMPGCVSGCVESCVDQPSGDYQSCKGCSVYVSCVNGVLYDNRPCPDNLVWNDNTKRCEHTSPTCVSECVDSCAGLPDGHYHSCFGCEYYVSCTNGLKVDRRPCPANLVWDDILKRCEFISSSCG